MASGPETILLSLLLVLVAAKLGAEAARRVRQPPVVGEMLAGILLGPSLLNLLPDFAAAPLGEDAIVLSALALLGVLFLLFEVGLESDIQGMRRVGASAGLVGFLGVIVSLAAGAAVSWLVATRFEWVVTPTAIGNPTLMHIFIGATLTATSVGITARVLTDMGKIKTVEARIILGAAVFDDVLGLVVLAIVGGLVTDPTAVTALGSVRVLAIALAFFFAAIALGAWLAPHMLRYAGHVLGDGYGHLAFATTWMLLLSYLSTLVGLASIVGAFAAGLGLSRSPERHTVFDHLRPVASLFVGVFFVVLGARVDLTQIPINDLTLVITVTLGLTVIGILAKLAAGLGVVGRGADRFVVGIGMVPRGEVGLIFALFGLQHALLANWQYAILILVVLLTTLITPFWLKRVARRFQEAEGASAAPSRLGKAIDP